VRWLLVLAITLSAATARAHVAPSVDDNNRYLKITPAADRVRVAYTVFYGEVPGAALRPTLDADHDGRIDDAEAQAYGDRLAADVAAALDLTVDGHPVRVTWSTVSVGLGTPATRGGAFSVDLIAWACLASPRGAHALTLRDRYRVPRAGETEVKVEDGLGITIDHARIGTIDDASRDYRFLGPGGPLTDDGLDVAFTASAKAPLTDDTTCTRAARPARHLGLGLAVGGAAALVTVALALRRRHSKR
jgi:hypothetical protein